MESVVPELNREAARLAREAADEATAKTPDRPRFVAGVLGPTNRTASISPDVNDPGFRNTSFDELCDAYAEATHGLIEGGSDIILVETIFDTLNAKAALYAVERVFDERGDPTAGHDLGHHHRCLGAHPVWADHRGLLELGAARAADRDRPQLRARRDRAAAVRRGAVAGRRRVGERAPERRPAERVRRVRRDPGVDGAESSSEFADAGFLNMVGGCCGTTPDHIRAIAGVVRGRTCRRARCRARRSTAGCRAWSRWNIVSRVAVRQRRRAHQRHRLGAVQATDQGGRATRRRSRSRASRSRTARRSSTSTWTRGCSTPRQAMETFPPPDRGGAGHRRVPS